MKMWPRRQRCAHFFHEGRIVGKLEIPAAVRLHGELSTRQLSQERTQASFGSYKIDNGNEYACDFMH
jgi:hypothetical protein